MDELLGAGPPVMLIIRVLITLFLAVLFLQSGLDKVLDWKGNLKYFTGHFRGSPLTRAVPLMTAMITLTELSAGAVCAIGVVALVLFESTQWALAGTILCSVNIIMLFLGQRVAKDYAGAEVLATYFILTIIGLFMLQ